VRSTLRLWQSACFGTLFVPSAALAAEVTCYVDSINGDDTKTGLSEAEAVER